MITLEDFDYHLPSSLIARYPSCNRGDSRLLHVSKENNLYHRSFADFPSLLKANDLLIFNDSRVMAARLFACKATGGKIELLIERIVDHYYAWSHIKSSKSPKKGAIIYLLAKQDSTKMAGYYQAEVVDRNHELFLLRFNKPLTTIIDAIGHIPIPPYFQREAVALDYERYQTVYAKPFATEMVGSVAAPTAGLHFDHVMLTEIQAMLGVDIAFVTLHVGSGTFQPLRHSVIANNRLHNEWIEVSSDICHKIQATKAKGGRIIAVGTTTVRSLETAKGKPYLGDTSLFIYPGYRFQIVDAILTNFHLPRSSLLLLIAAFLGVANLKHVYQQAVINHYRFYSYGDAMFIEKQQK